MYEFSQNANINNKHNLYIPLTQPSPQPDRRAALRRVAARILRTKRVHVHPRLGGLRCHLCGFHALFSLQAEKSFDLDAIA